MPMSVKRVESATLRGTSSAIARRTSRGSSAKTAMRSAFDGRAQATGKLRSTALNRSPGWTSSSARRPDGAR
jgi:hypothetical protein